MCVDAHDPWVCITTDCGASFSCRAMLFLGLQAQLKGRGEGSGAESVQESAIRLARRDYDEDWLRRGIVDKMEVWVGAPIFSADEVSCTEIVATVFALASPSCMCMMQPTPTPALFYSPRAARCRLPAHAHTRMHTDGSGRLDVGVLRFWT